MQDAVDAGTAQIGIDDDGLAAALGDDTGQVGGDGGLAILRGGTGDQDGMDGQVKAGKLKIGAQGAKGFGDGGAGFGGGDEGIFIVRVADDGAEDRDAKPAGKLVGVADGVIQEFDQENAAGGDACRPTTAARAASLMGVGLIGDIGGTAGLCWMTPEEDWASASKRLW